MAKVLLVIPHDRFRDEEYTSVHSILIGDGHSVSVGSSHHSQAQGHFGLLVNVDVELEYVTAADYDGIVFIGGRGVEEYFEDPDIIALIRSFDYEKKLIAALGMAVKVLSYAGVLAGKQVTCDSSTIQEVQTSGGFFTGALVEEDGNIITGFGLAARDDFAKEISNSLEGNGGIRKRGKIGA